MTIDVDWNHEELVPIRDKVYKYIKNSILLGEFKAGERLIERELADRLHVSRTPIREALLRLESQGFVKTLPRKGVVVMEITEEEIMEIFTIVSSLEVLIVKLASQKVTEESMEKLRAIIRRIEIAMESDEEVSELHMEIKNALYQTAKSPRLYEMLSDLSDYIQVFSNKGNEIPGRKQVAMEEHMKILQAFCDRQFELAEYLTRIHIENAKNAYQQVLQK